MKGRNNLKSPINNKEEMLDKSNVNVDANERKDKFCTGNHLFPPKPVCPPPPCPPPCCPDDSCTCPEGSCTCPDGACPQSVELVQNPSFEIACTTAGCTVFANWAGVNIAKDTNAPLTGNAAAVLGVSRNLNVTLTQTITGVTESCPYKFSFSVNAQNLNNANGVFATNAYWIPSNQSALDNTTNPIKIDGRFSGNNYVFIHRITNVAPAGTTGITIAFTKTGVGKVLIDDVSLYR